MIREVSRFLVYAITLHFSSPLCFGRWRSHFPCIGGPYWWVPLGSESDRCVAMVPHHGSWISSMSVSLLISKMACVRLLFRCTFTDCTFMSCTDIFKVRQYVPLAQRVQP